MVKNTDDSFFRYIRGFLTIYLPKSRCYSPNTVKSYRDTINLFRGFLWKIKEIPFTAIRFTMINHALIYEFLEWLQTSRHCSVSTRNQRLAALKSFLNYCAIEDPALVAIYLDVQNVTALREIKKRVSFFSQNALKILLSLPDSNNNPGIRNRFLMILMYETGGRIQEILNLKIRDLHLEFDTPVVYLTGKGNKTRAVPLMDKTISHLMVYLRLFHPQYPYGIDDYLFYTVIHGCKQAMSPDNVSVFLKKYAYQAKKICPEIPDNIHAHMFRHSKAMHLFQAGIPLSYIKDFLGHVSVTTTSIYASADITMIKEALEKAASQGKVTSEIPIWDGNEDLILKLCGLI
ncbi:MAG: tyrosine-type recombinase/integrase [Flexilinea sp.]